MKLSKETLKTISQVLTQYGEEYVEMTRDKLEQEGVTPPSNLYDSVQFNVVSEGQEISLLISMADYAEFVDKGRGPGKFPPPKAIENWIKRKGIIPRNMSGTLEQNTKSLTYLIGRKISREGTEGKDFIKTIDIQRLMELMEEQLKETITEDIRNEILSGLKLFN